MLTPERDGPNATPQDPRVSAPICPDRESDPPDSDSAGTQASSAPPSCLRGRRKRRRLRVRFQAPPSPVLFSSEDQAVPQGEEEIGYLGHGGAGGKRAKDKPRGFAAEDPGAGLIAPWLRLGIRMKETSASW